jgi:hypothetical protein
MKGLTAGVLSAGLALGLGAGVARAQKWTGSVPLGDVARQLKAQRAKSTKKPRMFTNDDLIALRSASELPSPSPVTSSPAAATEASADDKTNQEAAANLNGKNPAIPIEWGKAAPGEDYIDRMSKVQVVPEGPRKDKDDSPAVAKVAQHPGTAPAQAAVKMRQIAVAEPAAGWAKARFRAAQGAGSAGCEPGPISASAINSQAPPRQDLGYVERADGKVEAIVAEGGHIGLIEETKEFMKNLHIPAPSPAELEMALAPPPPNPPEAAVPEADQPSPAALALDAGLPAMQGAADVAQLQQPQAPLADNGQSQSEASLQAEPLADYAGDQFRPKPPENLQPANVPEFVTAAPDVVANRSSVTPIGYVEKAGGEKEAIVEVQDRVFLVHEGELFADKYRVLRVTALSVEIVEERTEASSAAIDRRRNVQVVPESR